MYYVVIILMTQLSKVVNIGYRPRPFNNMTGPHVQQSIYFTSIT